MVELHSFNEDDQTLTRTENCEGKEIDERKRSAANDDDKSDDSDGITSDLKAYKKQLTTFLSSIRKQNETSRKSIEQLKAYSKGGSLLPCSQVDLKNDCHTCRYLEF